MRHKGTSLCAIAVLAVAFAAWSPPAAAQPRHGGHGPGPGVHTHVAVGFGYWPYYAPYFGFWDPFFGPYPWYPYPVAYYGASFDRTSGVRLQVTPRETEVYVDNYRAGVVDDFDGTFQRLNLPAGEHEILLYLPGYRTVRQTVYLAVGATYKIRHAMEPLAPGEAQEPRPEPAAPPPPPQPGTPVEPGAPVAFPSGPPPGYGAAPPNAPGRADQGAFGTLSIRVQPGDAEVLIDGEPWRGPGGSERLVVQVTEGTHRVVVRKQGFDEFSTEVRVQRGQTETINVSLLRRDEA